MTDRLPPLTALRAFDAAARHMSFADAAAELNVTPAALSFQIKSLEEHLGQPVFRRLNRAVELTEAGRILAPGTQDGFAALTAAWRSARRLSDTSVIRLTAGPAFTAKWLAPRMFSFASAHPEIELRFSATLRLLDFDRDDVDLAIRFGYPGSDGDLYSRTIMEEWVTPMASPELAATLKTPEDLLSATLLHQDDTRFLKPAVTWEAWFRATGLGEIPKGGLRFSQADHALDAALASVGVVMGRRSLAARDLAEGRLVAPFEMALTTEANYRIVCPEGTQERAHIKAFIDWIEAEVEDLSALDADRVYVSASDVEQN